MIDEQIVDQYVYVCEKEVAEEEDERIRKR